MKKWDFVSLVAKKTNLTKQQANEVLEEIGNIIVEECRDKGEDVPLGSIGVFKQKVNAARKGRNPLTGETIDVKESRNLTFRVAASAENVADDALEGIVAGDYLAGGKILAELPHEDAELPRGNVHRAEVLPLPCPRIAEVAAFRQHIRLYALVLGPGREDRLWREVLPCLLHQDCDLPVLGSVSFADIRR